MFGLKFKSFASGVLVTALVWIVYSLYWTQSFQGGNVQDSPSGKLTLTIFAPLQETVAGSYHLTLKDKATGQTLRSLTLKLGATEKTRSLRGGTVSVSWDAAESYSDVLIDGEFLLRLSLPEIRE